MPVEEPIMNSRIAVYFAAIASGIAMILCAVLIGVAAAFMIETRNQKMTVETFREGDVTWACLIVRSGHRIEDMSCERLENWQG